MLYFWGEGLDMNWLNRLPGSRREPSGLEWTLLKRLPRLLAAGTIAPALLYVIVQQGWTALDAKAALQLQYTVIGVVLFHWMAMLMLAILCVIVVIMKGHAYVADAYPLPDTDD